MKVKRNIHINHIKKAAEILKTIGHPIRLSVLQSLEAAEPKSVSEIQADLGMDVEQSLLSHHLIKMKDRGLLQSEKIGMNVYYSITDRHILKIFDCMESCGLI